MGPNITWDCGDSLQQMWHSPCLHKSRALPPLNNMGQHPLLPHPLQNMGQELCICPSDRMCYQSATQGSNYHSNWRTHAKIHVLLWKKTMMKMTKGKTWVEVDWQARSKLLPCTKQAPQQADRVFLMKALQHPQKFSLVSEASYRLSQGVSCWMVLGSWLEWLGSFDFAILAANKLPWINQSTMEQVKTDWRDLTEREIELAQW